MSAGDAFHPHLHGRRVKQRQQFGRAITKILMGLTLGPAKALNLTEACDTTIPPYAAKLFVKLDAYSAIIEFTQACDAQNWEKALNTLHELPISGLPISHVFNIEAYEKDIRSKLEEEERDTSYSLIQRMLRMKKPNAKRIREALHVFARRYPEYDPKRLRQMFPQG